MSEETADINTPVEKSIDTKPTKSNVKASQAPVSTTEPKKDVFGIYNPTAEVVELDFGRDKSVRLDPYASVEVSSEFREHRSLKALEGILKIL